MKDVCRLEMWRLNGENSGYYMEKGGSSPPFRTMIKEKGWQNLPPFFFYRSKFLIEIFCSFCGRGVLDLSNRKGLSRPASECVRHHFFLPVENPNRRA
jgi:hypothetical protein